MDRFIEGVFAFCVWVDYALKSNMDRFIAGRNLALGYCIKPLKSNMDRFIDIVIN